MLQSQQVVTNLMGPGAKRIFGAASTADGQLCARIVDYPRVGRPDSTRLGSNTCGCWPGRVQGECPFARVGPESAGIRPMMLQPIWPSIVGTRRPRCMSLATSAAPVAVKRPATAQLLLPEIETRGSVAALREPPRDLTSSASAAGIAGLGWPSGALLSLDSAKEACTSRAHS